MLDTMRVLVTVYRVTKKIFAKRPVAYVVDLAARKSA